jgi:serine protease Do
MTRQAGALIGLTAVVSFLLGLVSAGTPSRGQSARVEALPLPSGSARAQPLNIATGSPIGTAATAVGVDFAVVAARLNAAVVNVDNASRGADDRPPTFPQRYQRDFGDGADGPREGSGSGFVIDSDGYILTNYHVVEGADRLTVSLSDGRVFVASVVGIDPAIDVALIHIPVTGPLPVAPFGSSASLRVGEWVCAIGNPLGYVHSVTVGVVSFMGRKVFDPSLDALIQTDAAITFGNSGGPLINSRGEVVGMTTAVSALASNIGFAIPIDQILEILPQLREHGRVSRGFIGVVPTALTPVLRRALKLNRESGALVQDVTPNMPAERAGLRTYDLIVGVDGQPVRSDEQLIQYVSQRLPGSVSELEVIRDGRTMRLPIKLIERPPVDGPRTRSRPAGVRPVKGSAQGPLGLTVRDLDAATMQRLGIPGTVQGVWVSDVDPAGPARQARVGQGQVILEVNRQPVATVAHFKAIVASLPPGEPVALLVLDRLNDQRLIVSIVPDPQS